MGMENLFHYFTILIFIQLLCYDHGLEPNFGIMN